MPAEPAHYVGTSFFWLLYTRTETLRKKTQGTTREVAARMFVARDPGMRIDNCMRKPKENMETSVLIQVVK